MRQTTTQSENAVATGLAGGSSLLAIESVEERRVLELIASAAADQGRMLFVWSVTSGLRRQGESGTIVTTDNLTGCLRLIHDTPQDGIYVLLDPQPFLSDPVNLRLLREIEMTHDETPRTVVLVGAELELPAAIEHACARVRLAPPTPAEIDGMIAAEIAAWERRTGRAVATDPRAAALLRRHLAGLPLAIARRIVRERIGSDGELSPADLAPALEAKHEQLTSDGVLTLEGPGPGLTRVGGLTRLKKWLELRRGVFLANDGADAVTPPKGVLLIGVQGAGKSLAARATASSWGVPLMRLDIAACYDKYVGETERRLRDALGAAEAMAPCVLWIDEIEKALAVDGLDGTGAVSRRLLGSILTWMSDRPARVFVVATANDIQALPPELVRKGRFDEIFFVDLPDAATRAGILEIHLRSRRLPADRFDLAGLAQASSGFSGAELEQAVVGAIYRSLATRRPVDNAALAAEIGATRPLSVVMAERIEALRGWAASRAVPAD